jgi:hypothetical protein
LLERRGVESADRRPTKAEMTSLVIEVIAPAGRDPKTPPSESLPTEGRLLGLVGSHAGRIIPAGGCGGRERPIVGRLFVKGRLLPLS